MDGGIRLRQITADDGPAIKRLNKETPDTGAISFFTDFKYDPYETLRVLHPGFVGVVVEADGYDGLVGMGLVTFGKCQWEGKIVPYAYFNSLSVHPAYRRRGIAGRIGSWRMDAAQKWFAEAGRDGIIFAGIQGGNTGSLQTAVKWSNQRLDGRSQAGIVKMSARPPKPVEGLTIRPVDDREFNEFAERQNSFYSKYNLYSPQTGEALRERRAEEVFGHKIHEYFVAVDKTGSMQAGVEVVVRGDLQEDHLVRLPAVLRFANFFLRVIPPGGVARRVNAQHIWVADEDIVVGQYLLESLRWLMRDRGTNLMTFFDPHSVVAQMVTLPRFAPKNPGSIVLRAEKPASPERLLYFQA